MSPSGSPDEKDPTAGYPSYGAEIRAVPRGQKLHDFVESLALGKPADTMSKLDWLMALGGIIGPKGTNAAKETLNAERAFQGVTKTGRELASKLSKGVGREIPIPHMDRLRDALKEILTRYGPSAYRRPGTELGRHYGLKEATEKDIPDVAKTLYNKSQYFARPSKGSLLQPPEMENVGIEGIMEKLGQGKPFSGPEMSSTARTKMGEMASSVGAPLTVPPFERRLAQAIKRVSEDWAGGHGEGSQIPIRALKDRLSNIRMFKNLSPKRLEKALAEGKATGFLPAFEQPELQLSLLAQELGKEAPSPKAVDALKAVLAKLPERQKKILEMSIGTTETGPMNVTKIAEALGIKQPSVTEALNRARGAVKRSWPKEVPVYEKIINELREK